MIFLSAQPDDYFFLWQLELQLLNFSQKGIAPEQIHVLIGYHPKRGLREEFRILIEENKRATFYCYPDNRMANRYVSSIRPHLIKQHFAAHPELSDVPIFYHDSDIVFREMPAFEEMLQDNCWYVSDTRAYLDVSYIEKTAGAEMVSRMCDVIGIDEDIVRKNDPHTGGAQYLLKNTSYEFWNKVEQDAEALYALLTDDFAKKAEQHFINTNQPRNTYEGIQAWCADMWAVLWNAWLSGHSTAIVKELDFAWPQYDLAAWENFKILHYAGIRKNFPGAFFCKENYLLYPPYYDEGLELLDKNRCGYMMVDLIAQLVEEKKQHRIDLRDVTFLLAVRMDSDDRKGNLKSVVTWLNKYFDTNISILEADATSQLSDWNLPGNCEYTFIEDHNPVFHRTRYHNILIKKAKTQVISLYDADIVLDTKQIIAAVESIRSNEADCILPYNGEFLSSDMLFRNMFSKLLDHQLFLYNNGKQTSGIKRAVGGVIFLKREAYIAAGMENEYISSWGPDDKERIKRLTILGYRYKRLDGPGYHLHHKRGQNSTFENEEIRIQFMLEYLKICNMRKPELQEYIKTWNWTKQPVINHIVNH